MSFGIRPGTFARSPEKARSLRAAGSFRRAGSLFPARTKRLAASLTLEAAFVLPLFLFFCVNVLYVSEMIRLQSGVTAALRDTERTLAQYAFYYRHGLSDILQFTDEKAQYSGAMDAELEGLGGVAVSAAVTHTYARSAMSRTLEELVPGTPALEGGTGGISLLQSHLLVKDDEIALIADFRAKPVIPLMGPAALRLQGRAVGHAWTGYDLGAELPDSKDPEEKEVMVYMTDHGSVYHRSRECTYLKPKIRSVSAGEIAALRNNGGGKYYPCEICDPSLAGTRIVTPEGNRYHRDGSCSGLYRHVREVPLTEVEGIVPPCSKCGGS